MANRFPLVVDTDDGNKLKEIPIGDQLDLANSGIANLTELSVAGALSSATLGTTGNITVGGALNVTGVTTLGVANVSTLEATTFTIGGANVRVPIQSDWEETDNTSLAFIQNKPDIGNVINSINDIGDVDTVGAVSGDILIYNGFEWQAETNEGGDAESIQDAVYQPGVGPNPLDVRTLTPSGRGSIDFQNVKADPFYGNILYTPPNALIKGQQDNISELLNDSLYVDQAFLTAVDSVTGKYLKGNDVQGFGRITATVNTSTGRAELTFDESGLLTQEVDTLETVTGRGASTSLAIEADAFNQAAASTSTSTIKFINAETLDVLTSITATNANFTTTNGSISATNGGITGNNGTFTNQLDAGNIRIFTNTITAQSGNAVTINAGTGKITLQGSGGVALPSSASLPGSPAEGDIYFSNNALYMYVGDDGAGAADWVLIGGPGNGTGSYGMQLPAFENTDFPSLTNEGALIYDLTDSLVRVWNGTSWAAL
jgi:hypothetical protein